VAQFAAGCALTSEISQRHTFNPLSRIAKNRTHSISQPGHQSLALSSLRELLVESR